MKAALLLIATLWIGACFGAEPQRDLAQNFVHPPESARPWVYWFWLNGNITSNGVTADLEAMKRVGIGGVLIMEVDQGAPVGPVDFMGRPWRALFQHVHNEANRLGLEVNMNNDAGWNGSGGPWITPAQSMQEVVWTETNVAGPQHFEVTLAQPKATAGFYRDIAVQAFPAVSEYRIPNIESKGAFQRRSKARVAKSGSAGVPADTVINREGVTNLTARMEGDRIIWDVPAGRWTIVRFGHTSTGVENAPAPKSGRGLECDKLSREGIEANFAGMMAPLAADTGIATRRSTAGLVATHIDSWENGSQNWTTRMREEFQTRRGYDLMPFLPVLTGRVVGSLEIAERFLWDWRRTISELIVENYAGHFRSLAHSNGMRFTVEAYGSPCDHLAFAGQSDEPMGEFWTPGGSAIETCRGMASAGHIYGKNIIGAEAFTSGDKERWLEHPATIKALGDRAFCDGINRFVFHRYAMQPWPDYKPGMTMGPWGQHYERTQTWWDWTPGWHEYLARCQFLLRQGLFVADICYLQPEAPPYGFGHHRRDGYDWDECNAEVVLTRMSVRDGRVVLPDGMSYRLLALSDTSTMTPALLRKIKELVEAGAVVVGQRPTKSPSLANYPECDEEVKRVAAELWGNSDGKTVVEHRLGKGRIIWGLTPEKVLQQSGVRADFTSDRPMRYLHRTSGETEIYFVANQQPYALTTTCAFRVAGKVPEIWSPESGQIERAALYDEKDGITHVTLPFTPSGSVFVVFREPKGRSAALTQIKRDGKTLLSAAAQPVKFTVLSARYGVLDDPKRTRDVTANVQRKVDEGEASFPVNTMAKDGDPATNVVKTLAVDYRVGGQPFKVKARDGETIQISSDAVTVQVEKASYGVPGDPKRTRDVREKLQRLLDGGESSFPVARMAQGDDPAYMVVKTLDVEYTRDGKRFQVKGTDPEIINLATASAPPAATVAVRREADGRIRLEAREQGDYELVMGSGEVRHAKVPAVPAAMELNGPWRLRFDTGAGAPPEITLDKLISWSEHSQSGVKYFSGAATYSKTIDVPREFLRDSQRVYLDLGRVSVMAQVSLNGKDLGVLWKPPFRLDVTDTMKAGQNELVVRVVNLWVNRQIGDEQLPEDSERNPNGTLKSWPQWVREGKPSPTGRFTFTTWRLWKKDSALQESGLLGPVKLEAVAAVLVKE